MVETNTKLIRILQSLGFFFLFAAVFVLLMEIVLDLVWSQATAIFLLGYLLLCGFSFAISGMIAENPEKMRKLFFEWLIVVGAVLIWVVGVYALLP